MGLVEVQRRLYRSREGGPQFHRSRGFAHLSFEAELVPSAALRVQQHRRPATAHVPLIAHVRQFRTGHGNRFLTPPLCLRRTFSPLSSCIEPNHREVSWNLFCLLSMFRRTRGGGFRPACCTRSSRRKRTRGRRPRLWSSRARRPPTPTSSAARTASPAICAAWALGPGRSSPCCS